MTRHDGVVLHTMVGSLPGTDSYFRSAGYSGTESHFGVGPDGTVYQWVDTARRADANLDGTYRLLSIETADSGTPFPPWSGSDVPAWTGLQVTAIAAIIAWAAAEHGFPVRRMASSHPGERGVGYHRLGCPPNIVAGGEAWSTAMGKVCPGDRRIAQIDDVIARAQRLSNPPQEDDVTEQDKKDIAQMVVHQLLATDLTPKNDDKDTTVRGALNRIAGGAAKKG